jgi:hypothetical protein
MSPGRTERKWWARQDSNLGPTDYEFKKGRSPMNGYGVLQSAITLILHMSKRNLCAYRYAAAYDAE